MKRSTFCILFVAAFAAMLGLGIISPFLPVFAARHKINGFWLGMIFAGFGISRAVIMPFVGRVSDRGGRKIFVTSGLFLYTIISLFYVPTLNEYTLTIVRMLRGLAAGMIIPIILAYVGDISEKGKEGFTTGAMNTAFYLGLGSGPLLGGILHEAFGFDAVFIAMSASSWRFLGGCVILITRDAVLRDTSRGNASR